MADGRRPVPRAAGAGRGRDEHRAREGAAELSERPAVVFGLLWAGLALARSLGRSGVPVTGIAYEPTDFGVRSRHLARRIPAAPDRDELLLAALREAAHGGRPVLFPERDESVHVVLRHWDEVRSLADLPLPDDAQVVERLRRKDLLRAEAERLGHGIESRPFTCAQPVIPGFTARR